MLYTGVEDKPNNFIIIFQLHDKVVQFLKNLIRNSEML